MAAMQPGKLCFRAPRIMGIGSSREDFMAGLSLETLPTPSLLLDRNRLTRNAARMREHAAKLGVSLRPHLKTAKSVEAARFVLEGKCATVSTLKEAEMFGEAGITDLLYAVSIAPQKLERVTHLRRRGIDLKIILDSVEAAQFVAAHGKKSGDAIPTLIEIDVDGHRSGVRWGQHERVIEIGRVLEDGAKLHGVICHAGGSYQFQEPEGLARAAELERVRMVDAAGALRAAGLPCPVVSVGSTPTALSARSYQGVTEVRAGVYMFFDLAQVGIGICQMEEIALSVLATVIGHRRDKNWIITDAGWMALSADRSTESQKLDQHYGLACDLEGSPYSDLLVLGTNQEHGILGLRPGSNAKLPELAIGARLRILPNHACATAAQHDQYHLLDGNHVRETWPRFRGW
jgi:D-serine deaminase-like pyridoxal phosphate-dependent protein